MIKASGKWRDNMLASLTETNIKKYCFFFVSHIGYNTKKQLKVSDRTCTDFLFRVV